MPATHLYAGYPTAIVHELGEGDDPPAKLKPLKEFLWGDYLRVISESPDGDLVRVRSRGVEGWIRKADTQENKLLEIVFVDIGQGDGALVVTPDDKKYVIDAGMNDNMYRFLRWRFGKFESPLAFDAAIMSHSDADHYGGFAYLFDEPNVSFKAVYTNGLMERVADKTKILGVPVKSGKEKYITELVPDLDSLQNFLATPAAWKGKKYPTMLEKALSTGQIAHFQMLDVTHGHFPGHEAGTPLEIQVLGPWPETVDGQLALRWLKDVGKTKNGHSIVMRFIIGNVTIFMGGDLNIESSRFLLEMHTGLPGNPKTPEEEDDLVAAARKIFACDVAKACHHGSADTLLPFMRSINPTATVVSSGDDESYSHPRADALGAIAKCSRGNRPLILSTELARSTKELIKQPEVLRQQLKDLNSQIDAEDDPTKKARLVEKYVEIVDKLERSVAVYGAINLRTDGKRVVLAYKMERSTAKKGWDVYQLEPAGTNGPLVYTSPHD